MIDSLLWLGRACLLSFAISTVFAGGLQLPRNVYLLAYIPVVGTYVTWFLVQTPPELTALLSTNWQWGLVGSVVAGAIVIRNVLSQPAYPRRKGAHFALDVVWPGLAYGITDALLLSRRSHVARPRVYRPAAAALSNASIRRNR